VSPLFKGEKTTLFWAGLIILSFASVVFFSVLWELRHYADLFWGLESNVPLLVGAIIFIVIGLFMMHSVVREKTFWAGLIILSLSSLALFQEVWTAYWNFRSYSNWWDILSIPVIVGTVVFILLGFAMMRSGLRKDRLLKQSSLH
jgi:putative Mn2+ efflux pump MntP